MKFSSKGGALLGLVLLAASAVTAAIMPNKPVAQLHQGGSCTMLGTGDPIEGDEWTCTITNGHKNACTVTVSSNANEGDDSSFTKEDIDTSSCDASS